MPWLLRYEGFDPKGEPLREALTTLGNGRFATRGAAPESRADTVHYPGTYAAGIFNRLAVAVDGEQVENESMVNLPDWQSLWFRVEDDDWVRVAEDTVTDYVQELDLRGGVLTRQFRVEDARGRRTAVTQRRIVSMADPFVAALDSTFVAENWSGRLVVRSGIDGRVANRGVARYAGLGDEHLRVIGMELCAPRVLALDVETTQSKVLVSLAARHRVLVAGRAYDDGAATVTEPGYIGQDFSLQLRAGEEQSVEKVVALYTSRDRAITEPAAAARRKATRMPEFDELLEGHVVAWDHLWERCFVDIDASESTSR
ncbi:MAG: hypothetical protein ACXWA3_16715, partial [Acidimicrobiales bacterium]